MKNNKIKRVLTASKDQSDNFKLYKPILLKLYPDMAPFLHQMETALNEGSCKSCTKKRWLNRLKSEITRRPRPAEHELSVMEPMLGSTFLHSLYSFVAEEVQPKLSATRAACADCCRKHIAQAIILVNESLMGYPEHAEIALAHLREAAEEIIGEHKAFAEDILEEHRKFDTDRTYYPALMPLLKAAITLATTSK